MNARDYIMSMISKIKNEFNNVIGNKNDLTTEDKSNVVSAINELVTNLNNIEGGDITKEQIENSLNTKVDKVEGKQLSTEDFTTEEKEKLTSLENFDSGEIIKTLGTKADKTELEDKVSKADIVDTLNSEATDQPLSANQGKVLKGLIDEQANSSHTHDNKSVLDTITQALIDKWNNAYSHISDAVKHITSSERTLWNTVSNKLDKTANAVSASKLATARNIALTGAVTGSINFDGSENVSITTKEGNVSFKQLGEVGATTDWNTLTTAGCYKVQMASWGTANTYHSPNSYNGGIYSYGLLLVFKSGVETGNRTVQIYIPHKDEGAVGIFTRMLNGTGWNSWNPIFKGIGKSDVGLGNVNNTSDLNKPISTATQTALNGKMAYKLINTNTDLDTIRTTGYYTIAAFDNPNAPSRGHCTLIVDYNVCTPYQICIYDSGYAIYKRNRNDNGTWGSWTNLISKSAVGLGNVNNTSDLNKPISTATQTALDGKFDKTGGTLTTSTYNGLVVKRSTTYGSSILYSNSVKNLGKIGFDSDGFLLISKGASGDNSGDILKVDTLNNTATVLGKRILTEDDAMVASLSAVETSYEELKAQNEELKAKNEELEACVMELAEIVGGAN